MESLRLVRAPRTSTAPACCRCLEPHERWDRIADRAYCPNCEESLIVGEAPPLIERTERRPCAVCGQSGSVRYQTFPLHSEAPVEIDLCPEHLRAILGRRLTPTAFHQLRRQLHALDLEAEDIFLLHGAFYDLHGRALQPATELE
jgi:hypothetical protein